MISLLSVLLLSFLSFATAVPFQKLSWGCFVCPAKDTAEYSLGHAIYNHNAPMYCQYADNQQAGKKQHYYCIYSSVTGKLIEDQNDEACLIHANKVPCEYSVKPKSKPKQQSLASQKSRLTVNGDRDDASRGPDSAAVRGLALQANIAAKKRKP